MSPAKTKDETPETPVEETKTTATETVSTETPAAATQEEYVSQVSAEQIARDESVAAQQAEAEKIESERVAEETAAANAREEAATDAVDQIEDLESETTLTSREKFDAAGFHKKTPAELADIKSKGLSYIDARDETRLFNALKNLMAAKGVYVIEKDAKGKMLPDWTPACERAYQALALGYDSMRVNLVPTVQDFTVEFLIEFLPVYYEEKPITPHNPAKASKAAAKKIEHQQKMTYDGLVGVDPESTPVATADFDLIDQQISERNEPASESDDGVFTARGTARKKRTPTK